MMTPDRTIVQRVQNYDPYLFIVWNNRKSYFELWRKKVVGRVLVTPITQKTYDTDRPNTFCELDNRILWWLYLADSWKHGGPRQSILEMDKRWMDFQIKQKKDLDSTCRDFAKDAYRATRNFYTNKLSNKKKRYNPGDKVRQNWVRPDIQSRTPRLMSRSRANALAYDYKRK